MASLGHPDRFQSEEALNLVRGLLGWSAPGLAGRIRASAVPLGNLAVGEFVLFTSYCQPPGVRVLGATMICRPGAMYRVTVYRLTCSQMCIRDSY